MLCSIVVPAFNARETLAETLASALAQDTSDIEILVVDDHSSDDTLEIARAFAARDGRLRVLQTPVNGGPGVARNLGYAEAHGDWIAVLDADDAFEPARVRTLAAIGEAAGADLVADNLRIRSEDDRLHDQPVFSPERMAAGPLSGPDFVRGNIGARSGAEPSYGLLKPLVRRRFLQDHPLRYPPLRFAEDFIFYTRCFALGARFHLVPEPFYQYRVHSGSLTFSSRLEDIARLIAEEDALLRSGDLDAQPALRAAVADHLRSVRRGYDWRRLAESAKARRIGPGLALLASRPSLAVHALQAAWGKARAASGPHAPAARTKAVERAYRTQLTTPAAAGSDQVGRKG